MGRNPVRCKSPLRWQVTDTLIEKLRVKLRVRPMERAVLLPMALLYLYAGGKTGRGRGCGSSVERRRGGGSLKDYMVDT